MKTIFLFLSLILFTPFFCSAQQAEGNLQIGLKVGPGQTFYSGSEQYMRDVKGNLGGAAGFSAQYQLKGFFLKTELLYENRSIRYNAGRRRDPLEDCFNCDEDELFKEYNPGKTSYHLITLPVLIGTHIKKTGFFINAGPHIGITPWVTESSDWYGSQTKSGNLYLGLITGIGYERAVSEGFGVSAEVRNSHSFGSVNSTSLLFGLQYTVRTK